MWDIVYWLASICQSKTPDQCVVANFTSFFCLTKSILLEMAVYNMQFKLPR